MSLSESELRTLSEIEKEFHRQPPRGGPPSRNDVSRPVILAAILLPVGLTAIWLSLIIDNAAGVALAATAYVVMVGSAAVLADSIARTRSARAGFERARPVQWNRKYLR